MNAKTSLNVSILIKAPISKVWQGVTDPVIVKQYFFGTDLVSTWRVGSPIYFRGEWDGKKYEDKGTILSIEAGHSVSYSYWSSMSGEADLPENYKVITYDLREKPEGTELTITQETTPEAKAHSESNWSAVFGGLKKLLEKN